MLSLFVAIWAEPTLRDKGVLNLSARSLNAELIKGMEYMIISDLLNEKLALLHGNIDLLTAFEGSWWIWATPLAI